MSQKQEKRARKILREQMEESRQDFKKYIIENAKIIKPKPKWIPLNLWIFMLGFFIKINK